MNENVCNSIKVKDNPQELKEGDEIFDISNTSNEPLNRKLDKNEDGEFCSFSSDIGIRKISAYELNKKGKKKNKKILEKNIEKSEFKNAINVKWTLPCGMPNKIIEIQQSDFSKVAFKIQENGLDGKISSKDLYYSNKILFKWFYYYISNFSHL